MPAVIRSVHHGLSLTSESFHDLLEPRKAQMDAATRLRLLTGKLKLEQSPLRETRV